MSNAVAPIDHIANRLVEDKNNSLTDLLPAIIVLFISIAILAYNTMAPPTQSTAPVALFFLPGTTLASATASVAESGGTIVRRGAFDNIVVARSTNPNFRTEIRKAGAWFVFNPLAFGGCFVQPAALR